METPDVLRDIDVLKSRLYEVRAYFPHFDHESVGMSDFSTAPFYAAAGHPVRLRFDAPLTLVLRNTSVPSLKAWN